MDEEDDINLDEWDIGMPLVGDDGDDAGFRIKNLPGETERLNIMGFDLKPGDTAVLGRLYHVVNGYMRRGSGPAATLVVFEWLLRPGRLGRRFREVQIDVVFAARELRDGMLPSDNLTVYDPGVVKVGPTVPIESSPITYTVEQKTGGKLGLSIGFHGASINPELSRDKTESGIQRIDYSVQAGYPFYAKKDRGGPDGAHWTFQENSKQQSGLPRIIRTAVLLERREDDLGPFEATFKTTSNVSVFENAASALRRAVGRVPRDDPIKINPAPRPGVTHGATVLSSSKDVAHLKSPFDQNNLDAEDLDRLIVIEKKDTKGGAMKDDQVTPEEKK